VTRGVAHDPDLRAQAVAAILAGATLAQAAAQFKIDQSVISRWVARDASHYRETQQHERDNIAELILGLIDTHISTLRAQLQATARPEWLANQSAADLADLVVAERDTLIRLLAGLRPIDENHTPQLPAPGASESA